MNDGDSISNYISNVSELLILTVLNSNTFKSLPFFILISTIQSFSTRSGAGKKICYKGKLNAIMSKLFFLYIISFFFEDLMIIWW